MKTFIKKAEVGQMISCPEQGIEKGKVVEVLGYAETFEYKHAQILKEENERLRKSLGDDFKELYFECVVEIIGHTLGERQTSDKVAVLDWREFQTCAIL